MPLRLKGHEGKHVSISAKNTMPTIGIGRDDQSYRVMSGQQMKMKSINNNSGNKSVYIMLAIGAFALYYYMSS